MQYVLMVCIFGKTSRRERRGRAGGGRERLWSPPAEPQTGFYFSFKSWRRIEDARNSHVSRAGLLLLSLPSLPLFAGLLRRGIPNVPARRRRARGAPSGWPVLA